MWVPMVTLPNVEVTIDIEMDGVCLVSANHDRVRRVVAAHPNFGVYLSTFATEFRQRQTPSILLWREGSHQRYRSGEALAGFRDAVVVATIPYAWARALRYESTHSIRYSDSFTFYPWTIDAQYEGIVTNSLGQLGWHEARALNAQTTPGLSPMQLVDRDIDRPILDEVLQRWARRFSSDAPEWRDEALFRSLNMAAAAAKMPGNIEVTEYDIGRSLALWVSAFEILVHGGPGSASGWRQVYELLERVQWNLADCREARYQAHGQAMGILRNLPIWLYGAMHCVRNDFLHGNPLSGTPLMPPPARRPLFNHASLLYRMALASFLDLQPPTRVTRQGLTGYENAVMDDFEFSAYQRDIEAALATVLFTRDEYRAQRNTHTRRRRPLAP